MFLMIAEQNCNARDERFKTDVLQIHGRHIFLSLRPNELKNTLQCICQRILVAVFELSL